MGAPMYEWKEELDGLGRAYPVCTTVLSSDKSKVYTDDDKKALDEKVEIEREAGRTTGKEAERLRGALSDHAKQQRYRNIEAAQALTLIETTVTGDLWARFKPIIKINKQHTEAALDAILGFIFDTFAGQPTDIREAVISKFDEIGFAETAAELSLVQTQFRAVDAATKDWLTYYDVDVQNYVLLDANYPPLTDDYKLRCFASLLGNPLQRFKDVVERAISDNDDFLETLDALDLLLRSSVVSRVPDSSSSSSTSASAAVHIAQPASAPAPAQPHVASGTGGGQVARPAMLAGHSDEHVRDREQAAFAAGQLYNAAIKRPAPAPAAPFEAPKVARIEPAPAPGYGGGGGGGYGGGGYGQPHAPPPPLPPAPAPPHPHGPAGCPHWDGFRCDFESKKRQSCRNAAYHPPGRSTYERPYVPRPQGGF